jgi:hypothetical protein
MCHDTKNKCSFLPSFLPSFILSFLSLSHRRSLDSPKRDVQTALFKSTLSSFTFQYPLVSFRSSCRCLCLLRRLPLNYNLPSFFHAIWCSVRWFLREIWPIKLHFLLLIYVIWLYVTLLHFSHSWTNWASPSASSSTVQCSPVIFVLLPAVCNVQRNKNHLLKMQQITSFFQKIKSNLLLKRVSYFWMQILPWKY